MIDIKELYWLAGLLEGEGCFYLRNDKKNPSIGIHLKMTDKDVVKRAWKISGMGTFNGPHIDKRSKQWKKTWNWIVSNQRDVASLLMTLYPMMGDRRQEAIEDLLELWKSFPYHSRGQLWVQPIARFLPETP